MIDSIDKPRLLLHSCCAPCSSYCLVYLRKWYDVTCFYYNPNITDYEEYVKREAELERLVQALNNDYIDVENGEIVLPEKIEKDSAGAFAPIKMIKGEFEAELFENAVAAAGLEKCPERGERCTMCFGMRLKKAYDVAAAGGFDFFTTTLTISPLKDARLINSIGEKIAEGMRDANLTSSDVSLPKWLYSDFKKKNGYKISIELSRRYDLYRQNYCGCKYSQTQMRG